MIVWLERLCVELEKNLPFGVQAEGREMLLVEWNGMLGLVAFFYCIVLHKRHLRTCMGRDERDRMDRA